MALTHPTPPSLSLARSPSHLSSWKVRNPKTHIFISISVHMDAYELCALGAPQCSSQSPGTIIATTNWEKSFVCRFSYTFKDYGWCSESERERERDEDRERRSHTIECVIRRVDLVWCCLSVSSRCAWCAFLCWNHQFSHISISVGYIPAIHFDWLAGWLDGWVAVRPRCMFCEHNLLVWLLV